MRAANRLHGSGVTKPDKTPAAYDRAAAVPAPRIRRRTFGLFALIVLVASLVTFATGTLLNASAAESTSALETDANPSTAATGPNTVNTILTAAGEQQDNSSESKSSDATAVVQALALARQEELLPPVEETSKATRNRAEVLSVPDWTNMVVSYPSYDQADLQPPVKDLPVYPGATLKAGDHSLSGSNVRQSIAALTQAEYETADSVDAVVLFYEQALPPSGWTPVDVQTGPRITTLSYSWAGPDGSFPYGLSLQITVGEAGAGRVSIKVSVERKSNLESPLLYPGATGVRTSEQIRSDAPGLTNFSGRRYRVVSYAVRASERDIQAFYMTTLSKYLYAGVQHTANELWFMYDYPSNPRFFFQLKTTAEKKGITTVELSSPLGNSETVQP